MNARNNGHALRIGAGRACCLALVVILLVLGQWSYFFAITLISVSYNGRYCSMVADRGEIALRFANDRYWYGRSYPSVELLPYYGTETALVEDITSGLDVGGFKLGRFASRAGFDYWCLGLPMWFVTGLSVLLLVFVWRRNRGKWAKSPGGFPINPSVPPNPPKANF